MELDIQSIRSVIEQHKLLKPGARVLVAVSGGVDSMVLCTMLKNLHFEVSLAHMNFGLRGDESDGDQRFVENYASKNKLKLYVKKVETEKSAATLGKGIQETARILRYEWFYDLMRENQIDALATAHHADDLAETVFFNFIRGTGLRGIAGIRIKDGRTIRPLLHFFKESIVRFASDYKIPWRDDSSNAKSDYSRNKIRNIIFPLLEEINPGFRQVLNANTAIYGEAELLVEERIQSDLKKILHTEGRDEIVAVASLRASSSPLLILFNWLSPKGFSPDQVRQVLALTDSQSGREIRSGDFTVVHDRQRLLLYSSDFTESDLGVLNAPGNELSTPLKIATRILKAPDVKLDLPPYEAVLDLDTLVFPLLVRPWKEGDVFKPLGMEGKQKISDFLVHRKVPKHHKREVFVVESGGKICWVIGHRISQDFKWTGTSKSALYLVSSEK